MTVSDDDIAVMLDSELFERRSKAMFLKNAGATLAKIAKETGVSITTVRKDLQIVQRDINNEQPMAVIARHRAVIFDIQRANYPAMMRGDKDAAATILRALERESKLLGLDSPTRILATVSADDFANEAARLIDRINELDADTLKELTHGRTTIDAEYTVEPEPVGDPEPVRAVRRTPFDKPVHAGQPEEPAPLAAELDVEDSAPAPSGPADPDSAPADAPDSPTGVPGQAGFRLPDDDAGWSNL